MAVVATHCPYVETVKERVEVVCNKVYMYFARWIRRRVEAVAEAVVEVYYIVVATTTTLFVVDVAVVVVADIVVAT